MQQDNMRQNRKKSKKKSKTPLAVGIILLLMVATGVGLALTGNFTPTTDKETPEPVDNRPINPITGLRVESLPNRVVQFSIDNVECIPQSGLSKADIIYEMPAEGGLTRLQAIFYGETPDVVGPIRSARPYFIDLAREYNAVFVHHGASQEGKWYLKTGVVDDISPDNISSIFWRSKTRYAPHNSMLNYADLWEVIRDWSIDEFQETRTFKFAPEEKTDDSADTDDGDEPVVPAVTAITVKNSYTLVEYKYIQETNLYEHYVDGELYIDAENDLPITESNILIQYVKSTIIDSNSKVLGINVTAGGKALLFTGGNVVQGTWSRADVDSPTIFKDADGNEFVMTRGKTWVHVIDQNSKVTYK
jgi:Protein of unknown function (DUF3048) N-terminal domain/Protein of unknown function (DUF3048) C-terminal domain